MRTKAPVSVGGNPEARKALTPVSTVKIDAAAVGTNARDGATFIDVFQKKMV